MSSALISPGSRSLQAAVTCTGTGTGIVPKLLASIVSILCAVALAWPLIGYGYLGIFTRYVFDDFCAGRNLAMRGFWGSQIWTYFNHSGRFSSYFIRIGLALVGGSHETGFIPGALLIIWLAAAIWAFLQYGEPVDRRRYWLSALVLAELLIFAMLRTGPDPGQSFYWQAGNITYTLPIILATFYLGLLPYYAKAQERSLRSAVLLVSGFVMLIGAGTSETNAVFQCAGILMAIVACHLNFVPAIRRVLPVLYSGFAGSAIATIIVVIAPGNAVREAGIRTSSPVLAKSTILLKTFVASTKYVVEFLHTRPLAALAMFLIPFVLSGFQQLHSGPRFGWRPTIYITAAGWIFAFFLIFSAILPGMYAFSAMPPERALFIDHWVLLLALLLTGFAFGQFIRSWCTKSQILSFVAAICTVALIFPWATKSARDNFAAIGNLRKYAAAWDNQDAHLRSMRSKGELQVSLPWNTSTASNGNVDQVGWISDDPT